jgi:hypothetical protein
MQATKKAINNFETDLFAQMQFKDLTKRGIEPANAVKVIINGYIDGQGDFGSIVGWAEADKVDTKVVAEALC